MSQRSVKHVAVDEVASDLKLPLVLLLVLANFVEAFNNCAAFATGLWYNFIAVVRQSLSTYVCLALLVVGSWLVLEPEPLP